jgi:hypothetical protein
MIQRRKLDRFQLGASTAFLQTGTEPCPQILNSEKVFIRQTLKITLPGINDPKVDPKIGSFSA